MANVTDAARHDYGVIARSQLRELGLSRDQIIRVVRRGDLVVIHPGVYRTAGAPVTDEQRLLAAIRAAGPGAVASHIAAAWLWDLTDDLDLHVSVPRNRSPRIDGVTIHRSGDLSAERTLHRRRIPTTTPMRALLDLGAIADATVVEDALDRALVKRLLVVASVERALEKVAKRGRSGAGVLRAVLDERALRDGIPDGLLEPRMARLVKRYGLPMPVFQHRVYNAAGVFVGRVDFAYPELKIAIEVDGWQAHGTPRQLDRDLARQNKLILNGWTVLRFSWRSVVLRPSEVAGEIAVVLGAARSA